MKLRNPFSIDTRWLFHETQYNCFLCSGNQNTELHHIAGRLSKSPLNASVLCHDCHSQVGHGEEEEKKLFSKTLHWLFRVQKYKLTQEDLDFINSYPRLYDTIHN